MHNNSQRTTIFISYSHYDSDWLQRFHVHLRPLEREGVIERWDDTRLVPGTLWHEEIIKSLSKAKVAILLISADFLASEFIVSEELPALLDAATNDGLTILPVLVKPCRFKQTRALSRLQAVNPALRPLSEMTESEQEAFWVTLTDLIEGLLPGNSSAPLQQGRKTAASDANTTLWNIPHDRNLFFTGRDNYLLELRRLLSSHHIAAISGLGGIGKTQTAVEYAYRYQNEYQAVFWTSSETEHALIAGFLDVARLLGLTESREPDLGRVVSAVKDWFSSNRNWLLIFDNADTPSLLRSFRPPLDRGHILITSRTQMLHTLGISIAATLDEMTQHEATAFLCTRIGRDILDPSESKAASQIAVELGCLPLALEQAGAYITANHCRLQDYLQGYRRRRLGVLPPPVAGEYPESVATTWAINFAEVETKPAAADLLRLSAILAPDGIPLELISNAWQTLGPVIALNLKGIDDDPLLLDEALEPLTRYSLIRRDLSTHTYSIHRIVQAVIRNKMDPATVRVWVDRSVSAMHHVFPESEFRNWPLCERLLAHARACVALLLEHDICTLESSTVIYRVAYYLWERAQYDDAEPLLLTTLEFQKRLCGREHATTAKTIDCLAALYYDQGHFAKAEPYYIEGLATRRQLLSADHPELAASVYALGRLYYRLGQYPKAQDFLDKSFRIRRQYFGPRHPDVALSLYGLARLHYRQAWYGPAKQMFEESLAIREATLGAEHPECAMSLTGLGLLAYAQTQYVEAEAYFGRSLTIRSRSLRRDHPDIAGSLTGMALTLGAQGRFDEMEPLIEQAVRIRESALGPSHPYTATPLYALGVLHQARGHLSEAETIFKRVRSIRESTLGPDHPSVAASLVDLASLYCNQGRFEAAEEFFCRALAIQESKLRAGHPFILKTLKGYALLCRTLGRNQGASTIEARIALITSEKV